MHIIVVGLNYRTAPVEIREQFAIQDSELGNALKELQQTKSILECVVVGTCNRTEIYVVVDRLHMCGHFIRGFMEKWFGISRHEFTPYLYIYEDQEAINHLFRVATGLDSMVLGETQIIGQVREAFQLAQELKTTGTMFNTLFKQVITTAKRAHSETAISENAVSVSYAAIELGKSIFGDFKNKHVMIIGAGKMSELTAKHLHAQGVKQIVVVNRTLDKAEELAEQMNGIACSLEQMDTYLYETDIIISSTGASQYVLTQDQLKEVMVKRKSRSLFLIDIAVPRDLDPSISQLSNVFLYDIDDLEGIVAGNLEQRRVEAAKVEVMIEEEIDVFNHWYKILGVGPVIGALQHKSAHIHSEIMESMLNRLPNLEAREIKVIRKLTKSIVNQMLHDPILRIKEMAAEKNGDEAIEMFIKTFALEEKMSELAIKDKEALKEQQDSKEKKAYTSVQSQNNLGSLIN